LEAIYHDYKPKGVNFYYLYKALAHPELSGYVKPFSLEERLMHVKEAQRTLGSKFTWLCDGMENEVKRTLGNAPNSEFIIDPDGKIAGMRTWSNPEQLRNDLEKLVGPVANPTNPADLDMFTLPAPEVAAKGVVPRVEVTERLVPVIVKPKQGSTPFYAKLRAEVSPNVLDEGNGTIYLGFHLDPLYRVHWNNLVDPVRYEIKTPKNTSVSPSSGEGPKISAESDIDPREFLAQIENGDSKKPLELTVRYFACNKKEGWCKPVTQAYTIHLERDPDGGGVFGRSFGRVGGGRRGGRSGRNPEAMLSRLMERDENEDEKISKEEMPERMTRRFDMMDQNGDGFVDKDEIETIIQRFRDRPEAPRKRQSETRGL
jgi:hypothetical protein